MYCYLSSSHPIFKLDIRERGEKDCFPLSISLFHWFNLSHLIFFHNLYPSPLDTLPYLIFFFGYPSPIDILILPHYLIRVVVVWKKELLVWVDGVLFFVWCLDRSATDNFLLIKIYISIHADFESTIVVQALHGLFLSFFD